MQEKTSPSARRKARKLAIQAIYQWQATLQPMTEIETQLLAEKPLIKTDVAYFKAVFKGVIEAIEEIDEKIKPALDRDFKELNPVECAVLRLAVFEFLYRIEIPYKVVIDEALRLSKTFGSIEGFKYVNGVLDKIAKSERGLEYRK